MHFHNKKMVLPTYKVAFCKPIDDLCIGKRVVAFRKTDELPHTIDAVTGQLVPLFANEENKPYAGMLAAFSEKPSFHVVFFDDGHVQSVSNANIRSVLDSNCLEHGERLFVYLKIMN